MSRYKKTGKEKRKFVGIVAEIDDDREKEAEMFEEMEKEMDKKFEKLGIKLDFDILDEDWREK